MHNTVYGVYFPLLHKPRNASKVLPEINETKYPCDDKCSLIAGIVKPTMAVIQIRDVTPNKIIR